MSLLTSCLFHCGPVAADMISTELVLREPLMQETHIKDRGLRLGVNLGVAAASTWLDTRMAKKPLLKWTFRLAHFALGAYAVKHNWSEYEKALTRRQERKMYGR